MSVVCPLLLQKHTINKQNLFFVTCRQTAVYRNFWQFTANYKTTFWKFKSRYSHGIKSANGVTKPFADFMFYADRVLSDIFILPVKV